MHAQVPQFIDIEDRIIGPLTLKQFGWIGGAAAIIGIFYAIFELWVVIIFGFPLAALSLALAFYKINSRPFIYYLAAFLSFGIKQRVYLWKKPLEEYDIFMRQKTLIKQPLFYEKITEFAQSSLKKSHWGLNIFGKKEIIPQTETEKTFEIPPALEAPAPFETPTIAPKKKIINY